MCTALSSDMIVDADPRGGCRARRRLQDEREAARRGQAGSRTAGARPLHADTCPGAQPWGSGQRTCEHDSDCGSDARCYPDGIPDTSGMCGAAPVDEINCDDDHRCKRGEICQPSVGRCGSRVTRCEPGCTLKPCADGTRCGKDGQCTPIACTDGYACKAGTRCGGRNPDEHGCARSAAGKVATRARRRPSASRTSAVRRAPAPRRRTARAARAWTGRARPDRASAVRPRSRIRRGPARASPPPPRHRA